MLSSREFAGTQAEQLTTEELTSKIEQGWARIDALKTSGGHGHERSRVLGGIVPLIVEREARRRKEEQLRKAGWSEVEFTTATSSRGYQQKCVYARCRAADERVGPIWGHGEKSVKRALCTLTEQCWCGTKFHKEGKPETARTLPGAPAHLERESGHEN